MKKIPVSVSKKMGIFTIRIRYPPGIPDPFSTLGGSAGWLGCAKEKGEGAARFRV